MFRELAELHEATVDIPLALKEEIMLDNFNVYQK